MMNIEDWPLPTFRMTCKTCGFENDFEIEGLAALYMGQSIYQVRGDLISPCDKGPQCNMIIADAVLVDTILEPDVSKIIDPKVLPEARKWREKLGILVNEFGELRR